MSTTSGDATDFVDAQRRRRSESRRLPPLPCGHADPMDCAARVPRSSASTLAARKTWYHLRDLGYITAASAEWWAELLGEGVAC